MSRRCELGHVGCYSEACAEEAGIRSTPVSQAALDRQARLRVCPRCQGWDDSDTCDRCGGARWHEPGRDAPDFAKLWATVEAVRAGHKDAFWADHWAAIAGIEWRDAA